MIIFPIEPDKNNLDDLGRRLSQSLEAKFETVEKKFGQKTG